MSDEHPIPRLMLATSNILGKLEEADDKIEPLEEQRNIQVGDYGLMAFGNSPMEQDLMVVQMLDAEEYAERFPDWRERMYKERILCRWWSVLDREGDIGWFGRVKFIPLTKEQFDLAQEWFETEPKTKVPDWLDTLYSEFTIKIHERAPEKVPTVVKCIKCGSLNTELHVRELVTHQGRAGAFERDGRQVYHIISDPKHDHQRTVHWHCKDCDHREHLDPDCLD